MDGLDVRVARVERRQAAYLQHLGIDVWVRRGSQQTASERREKPSPAPAQLRRPARPQPSRVRPVPPSPEKPVPERRPSPPEEPVEAFRIRCFHYGRVFVAIAEDAWPRRRFLLDVARAMNGFAVAERQDVVFEWPQPGADPAGGPRAFRAFLGHRTRNGERCLFSGQRVLDCLETDADAIARVEGRIYVAPDAPDAEAKKRLWDRIRRM